MIGLAHRSTLLSIMSSFCVLTVVWWVHSVVRILGYKTTFMREIRNGDSKHVLTISSLIQKSIVQMCDMLLNTTEHFKISVGIKTNPQNILYTIIVEYILLNHMNHATYMWLSWPRASMHIIITTLCYWKHMQRFALATCDECIDINKYTGTQVYGNDLDWLQV